MEVLNELTHSIIYVKCQIALIIEGNKWENNLVNDLISTLYLSQYEFYYKFMKVLTYKHGFINLKQSFSNFKVNFTQVT